MGNTINSNTLVTSRAGETTWAGGGETLNDDTLVVPDDTIENTISHCAIKLSEQRTAGSSSLVFLYLYTLIANRTHSMIATPVSAISILCCTFLPFYVVAFYNKICKFRHFLGSTLF